MKTLIVGQLPLFDEVAAGLYAEHATEVGRLGSLREVLAQPSLEPRAVLAPLSSAEDVDLLPALVAQKVHLLLVADVVSLDLRARAIEQGAVDVLFPPVSAAQINAVLAAMRGEAPERISKHKAGFPAVLAGHDGNVDVTVVNVSSHGFEAEIPWAGPDAGVVLLVDQQPPGHPPIRLYCRVQTSVPLSTGGVRITARFVGLTAEESSALVDVVDTLPPWPEELAQILATIDSLDVAVLRQVAVGQQTAVRLPAFLPVEEEALAAGWGTDTSDDEGVCEAAVARISGTLLADVLETDADMPGGSRVAHALDSLSKAHERVRAIAKKVEGDAERLPKVRDLQKRLASLIDRIQRFAGLKPAAPTGKPRVHEMKAVSETPVEKAMSRLPEGPARWAILAGVPLVALLFFAFVVKLLFFPADAARTTVAENPKMTVMGIRVIDAGPMRGKPIAIVDGSWYAATDDQRMTMSRIVRQQIDQPSMEVQDVRGRPLARVTGMEVTLLPLPGPRDTPPPS